MHSGHHLNGEIRQLADILRQRNAIDTKLARIIQRPPEKGHLGEYIASKIFDIELEKSAVHKGSDGQFRTGPLTGRHVNIKLYGKQESILDIRSDALPDDYLVLTGPRETMGTSRGKLRPIVIEAVYLFDAQYLVGKLNERGVKFSVATSVTKDRWEEAEIYPRTNNPRLPLDENQRALLQLFSQENQLAS